MIVYENVINHNDVSAKFELHYFSHNQKQQSLKHQELYFPTGVEMKTKLKIGSYTGECLL